MIRRLSSRAVCDVPRTVLRQAALSMSSQSSGKFGFVGLGIMGQGMAANLLKSGRDLVVWNRSEEKCQQLAEVAKECGQTVEIMNCAGKVVESTDVTFSMLSTPEAARSVFYGPGGVQEALSAGKMLVDCATLTPEDMVEFSAATGEKGAKFLEAPVSGSKVPAETGTLIFLASGDQDTYNQVLPELDVMGKASFFLGEKAGKGTEMKLAVNMIMGTMLASLAEGMNLVKKAGLKEEDLLDILDLGAMANPMFKLKGPTMIKGAYPANFPLKHAQKDMRFALKLGDELGAPLPAAAAANEEYIRARVHADDDFAAVMEAIRDSKS
uniref:6-phosphogluconate dehydrogenase NADP-binding domain-containing protein n=1 Tax=Fibrocapsa japonica TaxID=94617 RepID=A0A7S2V669_9STRA